MTADDLVYLTENFPPHNFVKDGRIAGASMEILELIWKKLDCRKTHKDVRLMPWARAIKRLENEPNIVLFGMGYSVERVKKFHWIGPYYHHSLSLIAKKKHRFKIHHINDAKALLIGVVREDIGHQILLNLGFFPEHLDLSCDIETLFKKINYGRFNLVCYADQAFFKHISTHHPDTADLFETVLQVSNMRSGFGFSKQVPLSLVREFQRALNDLKGTSALASILEKYHMP